MMEERFAILLIDDNPDDRALVIRQLRKALPAATVVEVPDPATFEAVLADGCPVDVVVTDYQLRWSTGLEVFHHLRAVDADLPVIMFTASGSEELAVDALKDGIDDYITKTPKHYGRIPFAIRTAVERRRHRAAADRAHAERRRSEALLGVALAVSKLQPFEFDPAHGTLSVDRAAIGLTADAGELSLRRLQRLWPPRDARALRHAARDALRNGTPWDLEVELDRPFARGWLRIAGGRSPVGTLVGVVEDVTQRKQFERRLIEADRQKDQFIATLGHELRNPLAPIRYAVKLLDDGAGPSMVARARTVIERQTETMARLLDQMLDGAQISSGRIALEKAVLDLRQVIENAVEDAKSSADAHRHVLAAALPPVPLHVDADGTRLKQVFDNVLQNAIKYTSDGGWIDVAAWSDGQAAHVRVSDTGIGVPGDMLERIFEPLVQLDVGPTAATRGGLGLGLSIVRQLVALHGGSVAAASDGEGRGTTIEVTLPLATQAPHAEPGPGARPTALRPQRILVADDQPDAASSLALVLELEGHEVRTALDGIQARELAGQWRPDVLLLDIGMPGLPGDAVARWVRTQDWGLRARLIAVTGWGSEDDRRRLHDAGFDVHLVKPVAPDELLRALPADR